MNDIKSSNGSVHNLINPVKIYISKSRVIAKYPLIYA